MSDKNLVLTLKTEAKHNKVLDAMMHMFAIRGRTRFILTIFGVSQRMRKEGYDFSRQQYEAVFKLLADLGVGKLATDSKGRIIAIKEIRITLQSLGSAVIGADGSKVIGFKPRNSFRELNVMATPAPAPMTRAPLVLTFIVNGKAVNLSIPNDLDSRDIGDLVSRLQERSA